MKRKLDHDDKQISPAKRRSRPEPSVAQSECELPTDTDIASSTTRALSSLPTTGTTAWHESVTRYEEAKRAFEIATKVYGDTRVMRRAARRAFRAARKLFETAEATVYEEELVAIESRKETYAVDTPAWRESIKQYEDAKMAFEIATKVYEDTQAMRQPAKVAISQTRELYEVAETVAYEEELIAFESRKEVYAARRRAQKARSAATARNAYEVGVLAPDSTCDNLGKNAIADDANSKARRTKTRLTKPKKTSVSRRPRNSSIL